MQMYERYGKELTDLFNGFANIIEKDYVSKDKIRELKKEVDENGENENVGFYKLYDGIEELLEE